MGSVMKGNPQGKMRRSNDFPSDQIPVDVQKEKQT